MASTNGSQPVGAANYASQRGAHGTSGATSQDPDALTAEIERTREDLAETLDAIAERVSPKRVASRTRVQVGEAVARLKAAAVEQTAQARQTAEVARVRALEQAQVAKGRVLEQADAARERVQPGSTTSGGGSVPLDVNGEKSPVFARPTTGALPPVSGVHVDGLHVEPDADQPAATPSSLPPAVAGVRPEYVSGGALVLLLLLLLRLRRRRKKRLAALAAPVVKPVVTAARKRRR